jgi:ABC-type dipeptide/oligopeptide/nickel transport system permease subunit
VARVLTGTVEALVELLLRAVSAVAGTVVLGRDVLADVAGGWSWSTAMWVAVALASVALVVGAWVAFWDD